MTPEQVEEASNLLIDREDLADRLSTTRVGDPTADGVTMGPVSTASQLREVREGIAKLSADGARVGFLPQEPQLDPNKTVRENVMDGVAALVKAAIMGARGGASNILMTPGIPLRGSFPGLLPGGRGGGVPGCGCDPEWLTFPVGE